MKFFNSEINALFHKSNPQDQEELSAIQALYEINLPIQTAFRLKKYIKAFEAEAVVIDEMRMKLVKKLGTPMEDGKGLKIEEDKMAEFNEEYSKILNKEFEIDVNPIPLSELEGSKISPKILDVCSKLIKDDISKDD